MYGILVAVSAEAEGVKVSEAILDSLVRISLAACVHDRKNSWPPVLLGKLRHLWLLRLQSLWSCSDECRVTPSDQFPIAI